MSQLDIFLRQMYQADVLNRGSRAVAERAAQDLYEASESIRIEVRERIRALEPVVKSRGNSAFAEGKQLEYLRRMQGG